MKRYRKNADNSAYTYCEQIGKEIRDISDEIPFDIPDSWEWCRLGEICNIINGFTPLRSNETFWNSNDIPWFTIEDIHLQGRVISNTKQFISNAALSDDSSRILPINTVLLCCTASVGEYAVTKIPLTTNQQFNGLVIKTYYKNYYYYKFLFHIVSNLKDKLIQMAGKTTFNFLSVKKLSSILIPFPPLAEQKRIVAKIEELLPYIERYEKSETQLSTLNETFPEMMKKSILQEAVQGKLVPQDPSDEPASILLERIKAEKQRLIKEGKIKNDKHESVIFTRDKIPYEIADGKERCIADEVPFEIPDSWCWCRLGNIFQHNTGKALNSSDREGTKMKYITTSNLYWNRFELDKLKEMLFTESEIEKCTVKKGDLLVCEGGDIGRAAVWNFDYSMRIQNHIHRLRPYSYVEIYFFYYVFYLYKKAGLIGGKGIGIQGLSSNAIDQIFLPIPPLAEQKRIVAKIEELMDIINKIR